MSAVVNIEQIPTVWQSFHSLTRVVRYSLYGLTAFMAIVLIGELARFQRSASDIHPWLGHGIVLLGGAALAWLAVPVWRFLQLPRVVDPPAIPDRDRIELRHLRDEASYLRRYLRNCLRNPAFNSRRADIDVALREVDQYSARLRQGGEVKELSKELATWSSRHISKLMTDVDDAADRLIYQESLAVGLATAASPNGTLDAFLMLWRSVQLVSKLASLYYGRPGVWGTLAVCRDVSVATALAGFMQNITDSLGGLLAKTLGGVTGVIAGPAADGITNALVLIRIGYLAKARCRSFRHWDPQTQRSALITAFKATQRVSLGLATEIVRQVGAGLTSAAGFAGRKVVHAATVTAGGFTHAAGSAVDGIRVAAETAVAKAKGLRQSLESILTRRTQPPPPSGPDRSS